MGESCVGQARLSWALGGLAGLVGAAAFVHTGGYFVTFMTGNTERAVLGYFEDDARLAVSAAWVLLAFVGGVVVASLCRRHFWVDHPHGPTMLTAASLVAATAICVALDGWTPEAQIAFLPVLFVAFAMGALNTSFVKGGEVSIPLSYVTGTLVKMGQGIERHISGGAATAWTGYFFLYVSFIVGATIGGFISLAANGPQMLAVAAIASSSMATYTYFDPSRRRQIAGPMSDH